MTIINKFQIRIFGGRHIWIVGGENRRRDRDEMPDFTATLDN